MSRSKLLLCVLFAVLVGALNAVKVATAASVPANCTTDIPHNSCAFYTECLEKTTPCGADGYAVGYGNKYCRAFADHGEWFTDAGRRWVSDVMFCLQTELVPVLAATGTTNAYSCKAIKAFAFDSHPKCYLQAGVCTLPVRDWFALARVIGVKQLVADLQSLKQELIVAVHCPGKWLEALVKSLQALGGDRAMTPTSFDDEFMGPA